MSVETISPTLFSIGSGGVVGFLIGFAIKKAMKILAIIAGAFFAALIYLQSQRIININWDTLQSVSQSALTTISALLTDTGQISAITVNLGIPLTGGLSAGFAVGLMKG
jgi:uncharacterized membrane protein (Fun14 family)